MATLPTSNYDRRPTPKFGRVNQYAPVVNDPDIVEGAAISNLGNAMVTTFRRLQIQEDKYMVEEATTKGLQASLDLEKGENGYIHVKKGEVGDTFFEDEMARFDEGWEVAGEGLQNSAQRRAFEAKKDLARVNYGEGLINHITAEKDARQRDTYTGGVAARIETIGQNPDNVAIYQKNLDDIKHLTMAEADRLKITGDKRDQMLLENFSSAHIAAIASAVEQDRFRLAEEILDVYGKETRNEKGEVVKKAQMTNEHRLQAAAMVERSGTKVQSQEVVADLWNQGKTEAEGLTWIRDNLEGDLHDAARDRWKGRFAEDIRLTTQHQTNVLNASLDDYSYWIEQGLGYQEAADKVTPSMIEQMGGKNARAFRKMVKADITGAKKVTDWDMWDSFEERLEAGDITDVSQIRQYMPYFSDRDMRNAKKLFDKRGTLKVTELRNAFIDRIGKAKSTWTDSDKQQWLAFQGAMLDNVQETRRPEDLDVWADRWFLSGENAETSWYINDPDTLGEAVVEGRGEDFYLDVPDEDELSVQDVMAKGKVANVTPAEFYTKEYLPAVDFLRAHKIAINDRSILAVTILKKNNKPVTPANVSYVASNPEAFQ
jgi:hypothetical protein